MSRITSLSEAIRPIFAAIRTVPMSPKSGQRPESSGPAPFITVSREPGAGGWTLAQQVIDSLSAMDPGGLPWTCWDRELVEKVASDHHISQQLIESLEEPHTWMGDFLRSLSFSDDPNQADECKAYTRVAATIRALARAGRVILVGRGGVFITRRMAGGIHIRLVAPFEHRVAFMAKQWNCDFNKAAGRVRKMEHNRNAFYHRYWPSETLSPETFTLTINTSQVDSGTMISIIKAMMGQQVAAGK